MGLELVVLDINEICADIISPAKNYHKTILTKKINDNQEKNCP